MKHNCGSLKFDLIRNVGLGEGQVHRPGPELSTTYSSRLQPNDSYPYLLRVDHSISCGKIDGDCGTGNGSRWSPTGKHKSIEINK